jgi:hypothetical protein
MRKMYIRLSLVAGLMVPVGMMGVFAGPASAAGGTTCSGNSGSATFSPGLTTGPARVQNIVVRGSLTGCTGSTVTGGKYVARLKTSKAVTCGTLITPGETAKGTVVATWAPKGQMNSQGSLTLTVTEGPGASLTGTVNEGLFSGLSIAGTLTSFTPVFTGEGAPCSKTNPLKKAKFTGSSVTIS